MMQNGPGRPVEGPGEPIAVVGIGCRLPGGVQSVDDLWSVLSEKLDCVVPIPPLRWDERRFLDADMSAAGKSRVREAGFLHQDITEFDASFFGLSPREAAVLDPRQWLVLESAWEAFEDAGIRPSTMAGDDVGVFMGVFLNDSTLHRMGPRGLSGIDANLSRASSQTMLAARVSHFFDLHGPSLALDTACSGSLVAAHLGCQAIWRGECTRALVGGVNLILRPEPMVVLDKGGFLNPEGRCRPFDRDAGGYARGEGAAVVVLEPLSVAQAAGHRIYAVICASGCNQDGHTPGITVPNIDSQIALLGSLCQRVGVAPGAVDFVEAHGTGTPVGDPVEMSALNAVVGQGREGGEPCWVGSIKSNIGHLEAAAGIAGMIKACLCLRNRRVAPSIQFESLNPAIDLSSGALAVAREGGALKGSGPWHALVNSFGYGGTNAAMLLRSAPPQRQLSADDTSPGPWIVPITARSDESRRALAARYADWLEARPEVTVAALARTLHATRDLHRYRAALVANDRDRLLWQLRQLAAGETADDIVLGTAETNASGTVFVFTGMGAQTWGMADELVRTDPIARAALEECSEIYLGLTGFDLRTLFDPDSPLRRDPAHGEGTPMQQPGYAQPANLVVQVALTRHWESQGFEPAAVVGHSVGEVAAAWAAGVLSLQDAFCIIAARADVLTELQGSGTMLAVQGPVEELAELTVRPHLNVCLATVNGPRLCVAAGPREGLAVLATELQERGAICSFLPVAVPYHHPSILPFGERFQQRTASVGASSPRVPFYSTLTGSRLESLPEGPEHWWRACAEPVRLDKAVEQLREDGHRAFLEVGPHPNVGPAIIEAFAIAGERADVHSSLRRKLTDGAALAATRARLFVRGAWSPAPSSAADPDLLDLPHYAWHREHHNTLTEATRRYLFGTNEHPLLQCRETGPGVGWHSDLRPSFLPYLSEHRVAGQVVLPGAAFVEAALAAARELYGHPIELEELRLLKMLMPEERSRMHLAIDRDSGQISFSSATHPDETDWVQNSVGRLVRGGGNPRLEHLDLDKVRQHCSQEVDPEDLYDQFERAGFGYGSAFRCIRSLRRGAGQVLAELSLDGDASEYLVHPALLDGAFQAMIAALGEQPELVPFVPVGVGRTRLRSRVGRKAWLWGRLEHRGETSLVGHLVLATPEGEVRLEIDDVRYQKLRMGDLSEGVAQRYHQIWERDEPIQSEEDESDRTPSNLEAPVNWLLLEQRPGVALGLARELTARGHHAVVEPLTRATAAERIADTSPSDTGVVLVTSSALPADMPAGPPTCLSEHGWFTAGEAGNGDALAAAVAAARTVCAASQPPDRFILLTDRAFRVEVEDPGVDPVQHALWGLGRVVGNEAPAVTSRRVDATGCDAAVVVNELLLDTDEDEVALRPGARFVHRFVTRRGADPGLPVLLPAQSPLRLVPDNRGRRGVHFEETHRVEPLIDEVECRVWLAGLNFKDVLKVQRRLPQEYMERSFSGDSLGLEFVGEVVRMGAEVKDLSVGDVVYGLAREALGTHVNRRLTSLVRGHRDWAPTVFRVPPGRPPEDFVGLVNYLSAWHCLVAIARLQADETVLIHSAAGGVGLAALHIARLRGARVLATAGTEEKRAYLASLGVEHVGDSRSLRFADDVQAWTDGWGVDVVLAAVQGEAMTRTLDVLAPFGRYVDIGKADILRNASLPMRALDGNRSITAFDLDLADGERALYQSVLEVRDALDRGVLPPLPLRVFSADKASDAFRHLAHGAHIGKVAVDMRNDSIPAVRSGGVASPSAPSEGVTLVVGGLGGLGLALARWWVDRGARHLVLVGRSGASTLEAEEAVDRLRKRAEVQVVAADATDREQMRSVLAELRRSGPPLTGVFHLASVWDDCLLAQQDDESFEVVYACKVHAATILHELTLDDPIERFVLFSSISALLGNPGQAAYSTANAYLDGLAQFRRAHGLPALAFDLGLIGDLGVATNDADLTQRLQARGVEPIAFEEALDTLGQLLEEDSIQCAFAGFHWARLQRSWGLAPRFARQFTAPGGGNSANAGSDVIRSAFAALKKARPAQRERAAIELFVQVVADLIGVDADRVDPEMSLTDMGFDSLMAVEFTVGLSNVTEVQIRPELITSGSSLRECALAVAAEVAGQADPVAL